MSNVITRLIKKFVAIRYDDWKTHTHDIEYVRHVETKWNKTLNTNNDRKNKACYMNQNKTNKKTKYMPLTHKKYK